MGFDHRLSTAVLLRVEPDGTKVYRRNNKIHRVGPATDQAGFYPPGGRAALYRGVRDPRTTREFAEAVRERRQRGFTAGVKPGPQHL